MNDHVLIFDTTLRDGEQAAGGMLNIQEKLEIAHQLDKLGVDVIEAGFPVSSDGDFEAVRRIADEISNATVIGHDECPCTIWDLSQVRRPDSLRKNGGYEFLLNGQSPGERSQLNG